MLFRSLCPDGRSVHSLLVLTSLQRPPLYNGHVFTTATSLQRQPLYNGHFSYLNLSTTATSPQRQRLLKRVLTAKITTRQRPVNQRLANGHTNPHFYWKTSSNLIDTEHRWSLFLFGFCFIDILCLC